MRVDDIFEFALERHRIYERRAAGLPGPWTEDPILGAYRFCNVYRELDAVSQWVSREWVEPNRDDPDLWFAMVIARFVNTPECLAEIGYPVPWDRERFLSVMRDRKRRRERIFSPAYMIATRTHGDKADYLAEFVFEPMWHQREGLRPRPGDSLCSYHILLGQLYGLASFLAGQVVADVKHVEPLLSAGDWWTFACSGPGSRRGLNRVLGRHRDVPWREDEWRLACRRLQDVLCERFAEAGMPRLDGQNTQNLLCEFDKRERVALGEGRPKQRFDWRTR